MLQNLKQKKNQQKRNNFSKKILKTPSTYKVEGVFLCYKEYFDKINPTNCTFEMI
jgi:hypothetical protein